MMLMNNFFLHPNLTDDPNTVIWYAHNTSPMTRCSGSAEYRPFFIRFNDWPQMFTALLWMLGGGTDYEIVKEFLKGTNGLFNRALYEDQNGMDADGKDYARERRRPLTEEQEDHMFGSVPEESQPW